VVTAAVVPCSWFSRPRERRERLENKVGRDREEETERGGEANLNKSQPHASPRHHEV
jgi:hypothetical protein